LGVALSRLGLLILSSFVKDNFHYNLGQMGMITAEWVMLGITLSVGILASLLPAWRALKIDISKTLADG
jgi:putative ABC transport system permease protein